MMQIPESVASLLARSKKRVEHLLFVRGMFVTCAVAFAGLLSVMFIDATCSLFSLAVRWTLTLSVFGATGLTAFFTLVHPFMRPFTPKRVAAILETRHPELEERLSTVVEILDEANGNGALPPGVSPQLFAAMAKEAGEIASKFDPESEFTTRTLKPRLIALGATFAVFVAMFCIFPKLTGRLLLRAIIPGLEIGNFYADGIVVEPGDVTVIRGDDVEIRVTADKKLHGRAYIHVRTLDGDGDWSSESTERMEIVEREPAEGEEAPATEVWTFKFAAPQQNVKYRVSYGPALSSTYEVTVEDPPPPPEAEKTPEEEKAAETNEETQVEKEDETPEEKKDEESAEETKDDVQTEEEKQDDEKADETAEDETNQVDTVEERDPLPEEVMTQEDQLDTIKSALDEIKQNLDQIKEVAEDEVKKLQEETAVDKQDQQIIKEAKEQLQKTQELTEKLNDAVKDNDRFNELEKKLQAVQEQERQVAEKMQQADDHAMNEDAPNTQDSLDQAAQQLENTEKAVDEAQSQVDQMAQDLAQQQQDQGENSEDQSGEQQDQQNGQQQGEQQQDQQNGDQQQQQQNGQQQGEQQQDQQNGDQQQQQQNGQQQGEQKNHQSQEQGQQQSKQQNGQQQNRQQMMPNGKPQKSDNRSQDEMRQDMATALALKSLAKGLRSGTMYKTDPKKAELLSPELKDWFKSKGGSKGETSSFDLRSVPKEYRDLVRDYFKRLGEERQ